MSSSESSTTTCTSNCMLSSSRVQVRADHAPRVFTDFLASSKCGSAALDRGAGSEAARLQLMRHGMTPAYGVTDDYGRCGANTIAPHVANRRCDAMSCEMTPLFDTVATAAKYDDGGRGSARRLATGTERLDARITSAQSSMAFPATGRPTSGDDTAVNAMSSW